MSSNAEKSKFVFQEGETVLCFHGPLLYEAKCLKTQEKNNVAEYLIHYSGWNKSWDEWVPVARVLKYNEDNLKKQQELVSTHGGKIVNRTTKNPRRSTMAGDRDNDKSMNDPDRSINESRTRLDESTRDARRKRTKIEDVVENNESYSVKCDVNVKLTNQLKDILVEDWHSVTVQNRLVELPASKTVENILDEYLHHKVDKQSDKSIITELVNGVKDYFEAVLATKLLYKFERYQNSELTKAHPNKKSIQLYGSIHLLRLFVKIGELLSYSAWDEIGVKQLQFNIEDIIQYLHDNRTKLFNIKESYFNPSLNYIKSASQMS